MVYKMSDELYSRLYKRYIVAKEQKRLNDYVFINPMTNDKFKDLRKSWASLLKRNNLPKIRLHDIRHLIGTYSINYLKIPIEQVSFTLGHTNITTTQKYITANVKKSKETIENLLKSISDWRGVIMRFYLKPKYCPYCGWTSFDDSEFLIIENTKCDHSFSEEDYFALISAIEDTKVTLKYQKFILKKIQKAMNGSKIR